MKYLLRKPHLIKGVSYIYIKCDADFVRDAFLFVLVDIFLNVGGVIEIEGASFVYDRRSTRYRALYSERYLGLPQTERWAGSRAPLLVAACTCMIVRWPCCACVLETRSTWDRVFICDLVDLRLAVCRMSRVHPPFSGLRFGDFLGSLTQESCEIIRRN